MIVGLCSLCLMGISLSSILALRSCVPVRQLWKANTKDAFKGVTSPTASPHTLTLFGRPRETKIPLSGPFVVVCRVIKMRFTYLLFRRIKPVETRLYAFARNSFAIVAIGILIFRTATALQRAQNEIGTRVISRTCDDALPSPYISILSDRLIYDTEFGTAHSDVNVSVSIVWPTTIGGYNDESASNVSDPFPSYWPPEYNCTVVQSRPFTTVISYGVYQNRTLELFRCDIGNAMINTGYSDDQLASYRVKVWPAAISERRLLNIQMPRIWLLNMDELDSKRTNFDQVRMYLPPLKLRYGSHLVAQASLITRRFIKSSLMKDIIFNFKPEYESLSLYPIAEPSMVPLNSSDINIATAVIRPVLAPGLMYHRNRAYSQIPTDFSMMVCDYVEDYRTSTIVDVIGSVGGLFALLQATHLLLFGRPLLWGLTGAKLLSPFGILGQCSSRGFKRRLKEGYHVEDGEDGTETIRIVKFLRDFVIDFGPADLDLEKCAERQSASPTPASHGRSTGTPM
ncbi:Kex protein, putative [Rhizoctonia solani AG-3 Rhs1AP]|uniref:Kex protein, putative n=1 Tax=Rhizoctonia solani AG-3 Rhs1AP TaxID=1086054 RepID=X8J8J0_9AGAM|nr:Kex protein, putative [Rhizoctonia solani AG-3 Rhs1AP]